jgi:hypothetical protein
LPVIFKTGAIFIKENTSLLGNLQIKSEPCAPGWRLVKSLDGPSLNRKIRDAGLNFFCMAGAIKATGIGIAPPVDRTVRGLLARRTGARFNSLEITQLVVKTFLGVSCVRISAQSRHIQESAFLFRNDDLTERDRARLAAACT